MAERVDPDYSAEERRLILEIARGSVVRALEKGGGPHHEVAAALPPFLDEHRGCFVTLRSMSGRLRGCIGTFDTTKPLRETLEAMAAAATRDARFADDPVTLEEVDDLAVSVQVLTPLQPLSDPLSVEIGTDGLYVVGDSDEGPVRGCFLPQVAEEHHWDAVELVSRCCSDKMHLPPDAWKPPTDLEFFRFQAIRVSE